MTTIEDIMYKAYDLGLSDEVYDKVKKLKEKKKHRFTDLNTIYTKAFTKITEKQTT